MILSVGSFGLPGELRLLDGITVVSVEQAVAAPFATRQLADLGARVIKIERTDGGDFARGYDRSVMGQSSYFVWLNRGKESLALDIKSAEGAEILHRLLERTDVFIQNLAPRAARRLGVAGSQLAERYPGLIACDVSGYGADGPWSERKAYDLLLQCETGLVSITGTPGSPAKVGISIADIAAGMYAFSGILTALFDRQRSGNGHVLSVSLLDSLSEWMGAPALMTAGSGVTPPPNGLAHATIAPYGPYPARDGTVLIAVQNEREFHRLASAVLDRPDLATDPRFGSNSARVANRQALDAIISNATRELDTADLVGRLDAADIANGQVRQVGGFLEHPQLQARSRWRDVETPAGTVRSLLPPVTFSAGEQPMLPVPAHGEHTVSLLEELGVDAGEIHRLARAGVIPAS